MIGSPMRRDGCLKHDLIVASNSSFVVIKLAKAKRRWTEKKPFRWKFLQGSKGDFVCGCLVVLCWLDVLAR